MSALVGNAFYVEPGASGTTGSRGDPFGSIAGGEAAACAENRLVILKSGFYGTMMTLSDPVILTSEGCGSVILGN